MECDPELNKVGAITFTLLQNNHLSHPFSRHPAYFGSYPEGSDTQDRNDNVLGIQKREKVSSYSAFAYLIYVFRWFNSSLARVIAMCQSNCNHRDYILIPMTVRARGSTYCLSDHSYAQESRFQGNLMFLPTTHLQFSSFPT